MTSLDPLAYDYLHAKVIDADTLRVQRNIWEATFETDADGRITQCPKVEHCSETWEELRRVK